jgi:hypothetical protein
MYSFFLFISLLNSIRVLPKALLDFSREFDITLIDNVVMALYSGSGGKDVSNSTFPSCANFCYHLTPYLPSPLATIGTTSSDAISRKSRCLDTSTGYYGTVLISANKGVPYFRVNASHA